MTARTEAPEPPTIYRALQAVMAELRAIGKDRTNSQQGFKFRGVDDVANALHPLLAKHGVLVVPSVLERVAETRQTAKGGTMNVRELHVSFTFHGPAGDELTGSAWGEAQDSADKATGKAHSMALKTFLLESFMVPTEDLEDADASGEPAAPAQNPPPDGWASWREHDQHVTALRERIRSWPNDRKQVARRVFLEVTGGLDPADNASWRLPRPMLRSLEERLAEPNGEGASSGNQGTSRARRGESRGSERPERSGRQNGSSDPEAADLADWEATMAGEA